MIDYFDDEWDYVPVSGTADIYLGGTPKRSEPEYWGGEIKWTSPGRIAGAAMV